jgi:hypothetical protein
MEMMHDVIVVGIPMVAILAGILFNRSDVIGLRSEMKDTRAVITSLAAKVDAGFARIDGDLRQFFQVTGKLEVRIDEISKR